MKKIVLITGASGGIGEQIAYEAAKRGNLPILLARSSDKLIQISEKIYHQYGCKPPIFVADMSDLNQVEEAFQKILQEYEVDVLINNAGYGKFQYVEDANLSDIAGMFQVNVIGLIAATKLVLPKMKERNRGHIINIASIAGKLATPKASAYAASKHAVLGFTNALRLELEDTSIHVTAVNPGPIQTNFFNIADQEGTYVKSTGKFMLDPKDVACKVVNLLDHPRRELNLPRWMGLGAKMYQLFPSLVEKVAGKQIRMK